MIVESNYRFANKTHTFEALGTNPDGNVVVAVLKDSKGSSELSNVQGYIFLTERQYQRVVYQPDVLKVY